MVAERCFVADSAPARMVGLMGRKDLPSGEGLWIEPCNAIHTFFMRFPIDVVYLDRQGTVVDVCRAVRPWRAHWVRFGARAVLELPQGGADSINAGDRLCTS
jgi:uncharacterized membrane protein (UPF0127 family)